MKIIDTTFNFVNGLTKRKSTKYIIIHHRAGNGDVQSIHQGHLNNGWSGIGYNFYVRKDGSIYTGRPIDTSGAHTVDYNSISVGVCFEGDFDKETKMSDAQLKSGQELLAYLKEKYPSAEIKKHRDFNATACPGKNFPFDDVINYKPQKKEDVTSVSGIVDALNKRGIIIEKERWLSKIAPNNNAYWLAYKGANMTVNATDIKNLTTVNDIVWELNYRGIMTNKELWLKLLEEDNDLYWLANKICNRTKNI